MVTVYEILVGKTLASVKEVVDDMLVLTCETGEIFEFYHKQDCCESVFIESIVGDIEDLIGSPLIVAEEISYENRENPEEVKDYNIGGSWTWTFYKFDTIKGGITVRWVGMSNGYYSESVHMREKYFDYVVDEYNDYVNPSEYTEQVNKLTEDQLRRAIMKSSKVFQHIKNPSDVLRRLHAMKHLI